MWFWKVAARPRGAVYSSGINGEMALRGLTMTEYVDIEKACNNSPMSYLNHARGHCPFPIV